MYEDAYDYEENQELIHLEGKQGEEVSRLIGSEYLQTLQPRTTWDEIGDLFDELDEQDQAIAGQEIASHFNEEADFKDLLREVERKIPQDPQPPPPTDFSPEEIRALDEIAEWLRTQPESERMAHLARYERDVPESYRYLNERLGGLATILSGRPSEVFEEPGVRSIETEIELNNIQGEPIEPAQTRWTQMVSTNEDLVNPRASLVGVGPISGGGEDYVPQPPPPPPPTPEVGEPGEPEVESSKVESSKVGSSKVQTLATILGLGSAEYIKSSNLYGDPGNWTVWSTIKNKSIGFGPLTNKLLEHFVPTSQGNATSVKETKVDEPVKKDEPVKDKKPEVSSSGSCSTTTIQPKNTIEEKETTKTPPVRRKPTVTRLSALVGALTEGVGPVVPPKSRAKPKMIRVQKRKSFRTQPSKKKKKKKK